MFSAILRAIQNAVDWLFSFILDGVGALIAGIGDLIPGLEGINFAPISGALSTANQYVPLDLLFVYLGAFMVYVLAFGTTKIIVKLIPFIG